MGYMKRSDDTNCVLKFLFWIQKQHARKQKQTERGTVVIPDNHQTRILQRAPLGKSVTS